MKILFLRANPVSPDPRVEKEVSSLLKQGYQVDIFAWDRSADYPCQEGSVALTAGIAKIFRVGIKAQYSGGFRRNIMPLAKFQLAIISFLVKHKKNYDVIHACDFDTGFAAGIALPHHCHLVYDIFDYYVDGYLVPHLLHSLIVRMENWVIKKADATIICTEERIEQIQGSKPQKVVVIHNSPEALPPNRCFQLRGNPERVRIAYVGILGAGRNLLEVCEFVAKHPAFELHIGGFGAYEQEIQKYDKEYDNICFYGKLSYSDTISLEVQCDIIPALYDPQRRNHKYAAPNKFYEAMYLGKPTVMAENTGMSNIVKEHDVGAVVSFERFEEGFLMLAKRKNDWSQMAQRARKLYEESYSWHKMEKRLNELYHQL